MCEMRLPVNKAFLEKLLKLISLHTRILCRYCGWMSARVICSSDFSVLEQPKPVGRELVPFCVPLHQGCWGLWRSGCCLSQPVQSIPWAGSSIWAVSHWSLASPKLPGSAGWGRSVPQAQICMQVLPLCLTALWAAGLCSPLLML